MSRCFCYGDDEYLIIRHVFIRILQSLEWTRLMCHNVWKVHLKKDNSKKRSCSNGEFSLFEGYLHSCLSLWVAVSFCGWPDGQEMFTSIFTINGCQENKNWPAYKNKTSRFTKVQSIFAYYYTLLRDPNEVGHAGAGKAERATLRQRSWENKSEHMYTSITACAKQIILSWSVPSFD